MFKVKNKDHRTMSLMPFQILYCCQITLLEQLKSLGDNRNYMPPILVLSSAKRIATQIVVIAKLNGRKDFILKGFVISFIPARNYLFRVSNLSTRIRCESCSILRMSMLTIFQRRSSVFIVNCEHISNFVLIVNFEQANVCLFHIKKSSIFKDKIGHIMLYVVVFQV